MDTLIHIPMTHRLAALNAGMAARASFGAAQTVKDETIAPVGRRAR